MSLSSSLTVLSFEFGNALNASVWSKQALFCPLKKDRISFDFVDIYLLFIVI
jgi:hypothetical protein